MIYTLLGILFFFPPILFSQPKIIVTSGTMIDLGSLYESREANYTLRLKNTGNETLQVRSVTSSCGCTATKARHEHVGPGDSSAIDVTFKNADINGPSLRHVYIFTNDTTSPKVDVSFAAVVVPVLKANPRYISFGTLRLKEHGVRVLQLENTLSDTIRILSWKSDDSRVRVTPETRVVAPHARLVVRTECSATTTKKLLGQVEFATDSPLKPVLKVSYTGKIVE